MSIFNIFRSREKSSANVAKERLQIIVAHERTKRNAPDYLEKMQREIMAVIAKYVDIDQKQVQVNFDNSDNCSVLELNVTFPEKQDAVKS